MDFRLYISALLVVFFYSCSNTDINELKDSLTYHKDSNLSVNINMQPTAVIELDEKSILKEGLDIILKATSSTDTDGEITSYSWREGNTTIGQESILKQKFEHGVHIIELEVKDNQGSINIVRKQITITRDYAKIEFDLNKIKEIQTLGAPTKNINQVSINNNFLFSSSDDGNIYFWELVIGELTNPRKIVAHSDYQISSMFVNEDYVFSGSNDNSIKIWNRENYEILETINSHTNTITSIVANKQILATSSLDKSISVILIEDGTLLKTLKGHKSPISHLVMIDNFLISYSSDKIIKIWDINNEYKNVNTIDLIDHKVSFIEVYKNKIITYSNDESILIWDIFKGVILKKIEILDMTAMEIYKDNLIYSLKDKSIHYLNLSTSTNTKIMTLGNKTTFIKVGEGILAIGLDNLTIKLFGNKENFKER